MVSASKKNIKYWIFKEILRDLNLFFRFLNFLFFYGRILLMTECLKLFLFLSEALRNSLVWFYGLMIFGDEEFDDIGERFEFRHSFLMVTSTLIWSLWLNEWWHFYVFIVALLFWVLQSFLMIPQEPNVKYVVLICPSLYLASFLTIWLFHIFFEVLGFKALEFSKFLVLLFVLSVHRL